MVALTSWPFNAGDGSVPSEDRYTEMAQFYLSDGIYRHQSTDLFTTGMSDELAVFADSSGMQVKVKSGRLNIKGHLGKLPAQTTLPLSAAHATLGRIDFVVARLDKSNNLIEVVILEGTPSVSPAPPTLTRNDTTYEEPLATVTVAAAATSIAAGDVGDRRVFAVAHNGPKAWGRISGGGGVADACNILSASKPATGRWVIVWRRDFTSANYVVHATPRTSSLARFAVVHDGAQAVGQCEIRIYDENGTLADPNYLYVSAWGDWA